MASDPESSRRDVHEALIVKDDAAALAALLVETDARRVDGEGMTLLMKAAIHGSLKCVNLLLPLSDSNVADVYGLNVLMWAVAKSNTEVVNALAAHCDLEYRSAGWSAFMGANKAKTFLALWSHCEPAKRKGHATEALMLAAGDGRVPMVRLLLPLADVRAKDGKGMTARDYANADGHSKVVHLIDAHLARQERDALTKVVLTAPTRAGERVAARL